MLLHTVLMVTKDSLNQYTKYYCFHDVITCGSFIRLVDTVHQLDSSNKEALVQCAVWLKRLGQVRDGTTWTCAVDKTIHIW